MALTLDHPYLLLDPVFKDSPCFPSPFLGRVTGGEVYLKLETLNPIGCFKGRGTDYLFYKRAAQFKTGVVAVSAGNFGQGLVYAARKYKIPCTIVVPHGANELKIQRIKALGAEVIQQGKDYDDAKGFTKSWAAESAATFIEDGKEPEIAEGAGTIAYELFRDQKEYSSILVPVGGGSLINGIAKWSKSHSPTTEVVGVCAEGAPAMALSFQQKKFVETSKVKSIADGISIKIPVKESLPEFFEFVDEVLLVNDEQIKAAMKMIYDAHRLLIEPAGAAGVAALIANADYFKGKQVAVVLCGSNLTTEQIREWII